MLSLRKNFVAVFARRQLFAVFAFFFGKSVLHLFLFFFVVFLRVIFHVVDDLFYFVPEIFLTRIACVTILFHGCFICGQGIFSGKGLAGLLPTVSIFCVSGRSVGEKL